jgi:prepilin-type N-terminal cleavage/methylation domain-containing protein
MKTCCNAAMLHRSFSKNPHVRPSTFRCFRKTPLRLAAFRDGFDRSIYKLQNERGFTLVEVIVAIVIAALCFSALAGVFSGGMRTAGTASELARASTLAQSLIATAGIEKPLNDGVESGTSADGLNWTLTVADESTESDEGPIKPVLMLKRVTARVVVLNEAQPDRARSFELSTLRAAPRPVLQP